MLIQKVWFQLDWVLSSKNMGMLDLSYLHCKCWILSVSCTYEAVFNKMEMKLINLMGIISICKGHIVWYTATESCS
jgi:hypothetical protein